MRPPTGNCPYPEGWDWVTDEDNALLDEITALCQRAEAAETARDAAIKALAEEGRLRGQIEAERDALRARVECAEKAVENADRTRNEALARVERLEEELHYPDCWDTAAYPDLLSALREIFECSNPDCSKEATP